MTIASLNQLSRQEFIDAIGWVFEHSPWVAGRAWHERPFSSLSALHAAMTKQAQQAGHEEQLALLRAHPDLGARAHMSQASTGEQAGAGLDRLTPGEFHRLQTANTAYREKFGFPFIYAVKGSATEDILRALEQRLESTAEAEFQTALQQVYRIAEFRLRDTIKEEQ